MTQSNISDVQIREAAYLFWLDEGKPHGRDQAHWHRAVELLTAAKPKTKRVKKTKAQSSGTKTSGAKKETVSRSKPSSTARRKRPNKPA